MNAPLILGRLVAVVGPSGVGKDSVMDGLVAAAPSLTRVRRTITRAPGLGGEDYEAATPEAFKAAAETGQFCLHWYAHGLHYGIPAEVLAGIHTGRSYIANLSRSALIEANAVFPDLVVLNLTASPHVLASRLARRGREDAAEIAARLAQAVKPLPKGLDVVTVSNDGRLEHTVAAALDALQPVRA